MLAEAWGRPFTTPESMIGAMVNVRLPERFEATEANADRVRAALERAGFEVPVYAGPHGLETRVSLQIYCDHDDVKRLADAVTHLALDPSVRRMRVVAAVDKFRGTASAADVAHAIGQACWELGHDCTELALADGGEGLLDALGGANRTMHRDRSARHAGRRRHGGCTAARRSSRWRGRAGSCSPAARRATIRWPPRRPAPAS